MLNSIQHLSKPHEILNQVQDDRVVVQDDYRVRVQDDREVQYDSELPVYTVLVPLYKEFTKFNFIIQSIIELNYPTDKLDVKIILEADDYNLGELVDKIKLPSHIEVIKVPFSLPRTKPKALNFAMEYCKGQYVVVFDAEDKPDPNQLLLALEVFDKMPEEYACLQAKLNFYNSDESLLAKLMSIEYSLWFEYLLKGLSLFMLPLPLGGTSNHFKVKMLEEVGYWDAYNVTEDADLGIRLYLNGYKTHIIDSYTLEEAPVNLQNWIRQRARWIKGFKQTFFVLLKQTNKNIKCLPLLSIYIFVGLTPYIFFAVPWMLLTILINTNVLINYLLLSSSFFALSYCYGSACYILLKQKNKFSNLKYLDWISLILYPLYFILHTIASYISILEIIISPFSWYRTKHGISNKKYKYYRFTF